MLRGLWQQGWFWQRVSVHDRLAKQHVILKVLAAFLLIGPREYLNVIVEVQKCRSTKISVIANADKLGRHLKWLQRKEARNTAVLKGYGLMALWTWLYWVSRPSIGSNGMSLVG
jgi:hypothetical protein